MEGFRNRAYTLPDKDDASRVELLSIPSQSDLLRQPSVRDAKDSDQGPWHNQIPAIKGWPQTPEPLMRKWRKAAILAVDVAIALVPLLFIGRCSARASFLDKEIDLC